eukprot:gene18618-24349_t
MSEVKFKSNHSFDARQAEAKRVRTKYPERIPVICEKIAISKVQEIDKNKYLVPQDLTVGQFVFVIRKRLKLQPEEAIYLSVNGSFPQNAALLRDIYEKMKDADGFLYIRYSSENTFGAV